MRGPSRTLWFCDFGGIRSWGNSHHSTTTAISWRPESASPGNGPGPPSRPDTRRFHSRAPGFEEAPGPQAALSAARTEVASSLRAAGRPSLELQFRARPPGGSSASPTAGRAQAPEGAHRPGAPLRAQASQQVPAEAGPAGLAPVRGHVPGTRLRGRRPARGCGKPAPPPGAPRR